MNSDDGVKLAIVTIVVVCALFWMAYSVAIEGCVNNKVHLLELLVYGLCISLGNMATALLIFILAISALWFVFIRR